MMAKKGSPLQVQSSKEDSTILSPTCTCTSDESKVTLNTAPKITHTPVSRKDLRTDTIERGRLRCVRTAYGNRVNDSSKVSEALAWDPYTHHPNTVSTQLCTSDSLRKVTTHRKTWQHDSNAQFVSSQRFAARNAQQLDRSLKLEAAERTRKLADVHRTLQLLQSIAREREKSSIAQNASNEWPHGLPVSCTHTTHIVLVVKTCINPRSFLSISGCKKKQRLPKGCDTGWLGVRARSAEPSTASVHCPKINHETSIDVFQVLKCTSLQSGFLLQRHLCNRCNAVRKFCVFHHFRRGEYLSRDKLGPLRKYLQRCPQISRIPGACDLLKKNFCYGGSKRSLGRSLLRFRKVVQKHRCATRCGKV